LDTRVLLANTNKRFQSIFEAIQILNGNQAQTAASFDSGLEVVYEKLIEVDNKLDLIMAHLGIEMPSPPDTDQAAIASEIAASATESSTEDTTQLVQ
jgi:hypothetical protein